jgi:SulP family sulfate permease
MGSFGLLPGLGVGILLAVGLFIVQYSRVPVVRNAFSGRLYHSRVVRSHPQAELLRQEGQALLILELQGYVFFGTANRVYEELKERLASAQATPLRVVMLDFRRVIGIDASAALSFARLKRLLRQHKMHDSPTCALQHIFNGRLTPGDRDMLFVAPTGSRRGMVRSANTGWRSCPAGYGGVPPGCSPGGPDPRGPGIDLRHPRERSRWLR